MDGHAEVSSSTTRIRDRRESPAVKTNEQEGEILDRKKKKKPKPGKKKKTKPGKKKKPNKAKPTPTKPVTTTPTVSTSTLKTTTILTTPTVTTTVTTTTTTVSPTTTATTTKLTTSTASATTTLSTTTSATTSATTTTVATSSTASTTTTTIPTTATTSSLPTTAATTADSGAGGECKATNGKPCIFPFKDGKEYNECKNEGGKYFWCATSVYDSGKYKHWSYCSTDGPCPLEGDGECRAENNKPCVFPFKDGNKEYNECADHGGKYFWCATGTNSAGKYTAWSECPKDGSCPLSGQGTTTPTSTTTTASTTPPTNDTSAAAIAIANVENALTEINNTLQNLETAGFSEDEKQLLETMNDLSDYMESGSQTRNWNFYDAVKINSLTQQLYSSTANIAASKQVNPGFKSKHQSVDATCAIKVKNAKLSKVPAGPGQMFQLHTISKILEIITNVPSSSDCCAECKSLATDSELFEYSSSQKQCDCYKTKLGVPPQTEGSANLDSGVCPDEGSCGDKRCVGGIGDSCALTRAIQLQCPVHDLRPGQPVQTDIKFVSRSINKKLWTFQKTNLQYVDNTHNLCYNLCHQHEPNCIAFTFDPTCGQCKILKKEGPTIDDLFSGFNSEEVDTFCLIDVCQVNAVLQTLAAQPQACNCGIEKCYSNTNNHYCSEDYECIQGNPPPIQPRSLTIKALNENNLQHKIWTRIAEYTDECRNQYNAKRADDPGFYPLTDQHQYGFYVHAAANAVDNPTMNWLDHFNPSQNGDCNEDSGNFAVLYPHKTEDRLVHIEPQLIERIDAIIGANQNHEWYIFTVNSPCAGAYQNFNQYTCVYRTMDAATNYIGTGRFNVGFRYWWIPGKFDGTATITCDAARNHWCPRVTYYRNTAPPGILTNFQPLTTNDLRYFLFMNNCVDDQRWIPTATC